MSWTETVTAGNQTYTDVVSAIPTTNSLGETEIEVGASPIETGTPLPKNDKGHDLSPGGKAGVALGVLAAAAVTGGVLWAPL